MIAQLNVLGMNALVCGEGETYHNGKKLEKGEEVKLNVLDRVGMATDLMVLRFPGQHAAADAMSTEDMVLEFQMQKCPPLILQP